MRKILLLFVTLGLLLAGCSVSEYDNNMVNVSIGDEGRYIAGGASSVDQAYLGLIDEDVLYNFDELENVSAAGGVVQHTFAGIPVGDYAFLAMLMDQSDNNIAMAIDFVEIEAGVNDLDVEMGPGFTLEIGGLDFELDDLSDSFTVSFKDGYIYVDISIPDLLDSFILGGNLTVDVLNTTAESITVTGLGGTAVSAVSNPPDGDEATLDDSYFSVNSVGFSNRFRIRMDSFGDAELAELQKTYPDAKGYKDYYIELSLSY